MNLSVIWRLQDMMSPVMNRVSKSARTAQEVVERVNSRMANGFRTSANSVTGLREKIDALTKYRDGLRIGIDGSQIRQANAELAMLQSRLDRVDRTNARQSGTRGAGLLGGVGGIKGLAAGYGLYQAGQSGIDAVGRGMDLQQSQIMLEAFVNNSTKAKDLMEKLNLYSQKYRVYDKSMLMEAASRMASTFGSDNILPLTNIIGKLALGNKDRFKGILGRLEQIKGTGYLQGDELNELMNQGVFGISEMIQKLKGITSQQFHKMKEAGLISYQDVLIAMTKMTSTGGLFNDKLEKMMSTAKGKWSTITGTIRTKVDEIVLKILPKLNKGMDWVIDFFQKSSPIGNAFNNLFSSFKPLLNGIFKIAQSFGLVSKNGDSVSKTIEFISNVVNRLAWVINAAGRAVDYIGGLFVKYPFLKYAAGFLAISYAVGAVKNKMLSFNTLLQSGELLSKLPFGFIASGFSTIARAMGLLWANPVGLIVLGVVALSAAIYYAWQKSEDFRRVTIQTWEGLKYLWNGAVELVSIAWSKIAPVFTYIATGWRNVMVFLQNAAFIAWQYIVAKFDTITKPIVWAFEKAKPYISGFWDWFKDKAIMAVRGVAAVATFGLSEIGIGLFKKFKIGYDKGASVASQFEKSRNLSEKGKPKKGSFLSDFFSGNIPGIAGKLANAGDTGKGGKTPGITDTVNGATSKNVTINLNSKIADINNYFNGNDGEEGIAKRLGDLVLMELNKVLLTGDRLAFE
jgi:tape measure domain-containing protein